jgi:tetratricopeptide (TPR) repeat protein
LLLIALVALQPAAARAASAELARADALWAERANGQRDGRARPEPINSAIEAYEAALAAEPDRLEIHWKLQRALWFAGEFAIEDVEVERRTYERALERAERAFELLASRVGGPDQLAAVAPEELRVELAAAERSDAAHLYFWSAINLGAWSRLAGLLRAVRAGVATRLHDATLRSIALDPDVERGGAIRLLSRLHSELPRVPLLSGWVDHARAVPLAERALAEYPDHPGNAYLLALALLAHAPERRAEALELVERTARREPRADHVVEDVALREAARELLQEELRRTSSARSRAWASRVSGKLQRQSPPAAISTPGSQA